MASTRGRQVVVLLTNKSGGSVAAGDVVVVDTGNDTAFTTTTSARSETSIGVAQETIANNATGRVLTHGYASLVNVPASVTRGHYVETHTVAKQATGNSSRRSGSFGQFLTGGTTPTALIWGVGDQTASGGGSSGALVLLEQHTASSSATLDFTTFISSTYDDYLFRLINVLPATNSVSLWLRVGTGGTPTYDSGNNYASTDYRWVPGGAASSGASSAANTMVLTNYNSTDTVLNTANNGGVSGQVDVFDPGSAIYKHFTAQTGWFNTGSVVEGTVMHGTYLSTTAVTAVRFLFSSGNIASGTIRAYGVAKS